MWKVVALVTAAALVGIASVAAGTTTPDVGKTVLLKAVTKTSGCTLGANPDRRCSPGAYYSNSRRR
jgi:hypothetical protein